MTAASPAASVSVPTDRSSSTSPKSEAAKRDSSRRDLSSAPRREEAPAMTMRVEAMSCQLKIIREAGRRSKRWEGRFGLKSVLLRDAGGSRGEPVAEKTDEMESNAGYGVGAGEEHQRDLRKLPDDGAHQDEENDKQRRLLLRPGNVLETVVADRAGHERTERGGNQKPGDRPAPVVQGDFEAVNERGDNAGCRRGGHPYEKL